MCRSFAACEFLSQFSCAFIESYHQRIHRITEALHDNLRTALTQALHAIHERHGHSKQVDAHKSRRESLSECFKAYELLGKSREAEEVVRKEMVRPWVDQHVHRDALSGSQTPVLPQTPHTDKHFHFTSPNPSESAPFAGINGSVAPESVSHSFASTYQIDPLPHPTDYQDVLVELFNKILAFISKDCAPVLEATERKGALPSGGEQAARLSGSDVPTYNVLANVIVDELLNRLASDLGHVIFAAGRPDIFSHVSLALLIIKCIVMTNGNSASKELYNFRSVLKSSGRLMLVSTASNSSTKPSFLRRFHAPMAASSLLSTTLQGDRRPS